MDGIEDRGNDNDDQVERDMTAAQTTARGTEDGSSVKERRRDAYRLW